MNLSSSDLQKLHDLALTAAARAADYIQSVAGQHRETNTKEAGDTLASQVVTEVDLESQRLILEILGKSIAEYQLGLLTEESEDDASRFDSDYFWCIDPLDGTLPFIEGTPGYSVSIALVSRGGEPVIGVVRDPAKVEVFHALKGLGAFKNGEPISALSEPDSKTLTWLMDRSMKHLTVFPQLFESMRQLATETGHSGGLNIIDHAGATLNGAWITQHPSSVYFKFPKSNQGGGSLWDYAASACLLQEWGQSPTDIHGNPLDLNRADTTFMNERGIIYASHPEFGAAIQKIYRESTNTQP